MPAAPRTRSKATKIAYKILGKPANLQEKISREKAAIERRLTWEETMRVR